MIKRDKFSEKRIDIPYALIHEYYFLKLHVNNKALIT